jgi:AcrR family transcriptional regulator
MEHVTSGPGAGSAPAKVEPEGSYEDLTRDLTDAATDLAREGGPEAVILREAARRVGVSATTAYRHFSGHSHLVDAVRERAWAGISDAMRVQLDRVEPAGERGTDSLRRLRAVGTGYLHFALGEPGLFRTAFARADPSHDHAAADVASAGPYMLLADILNELVSDGLMAPARRPYADVVAWAAVHGLAMLLLDGPLQGLPAPDVEAALTQTLDICMEGMLVRP